jgi:hypothetical protein
MPNGPDLGVMALVSGTSATAQLITEPTRQTSAFSETSLVRKPRTGAAQAEFFYFLIPFNLIY